MAINDVIAHLDPDQGEGLEGYITAEDVKASLYDLYNLIITTISVGPIGPQGIQGPLGPQGIAGPVGPTGPAPTFDVGTVETGTADVSLSGNESTGYHLNLVLPSAGADGVNTAAIQNGAVTSEKIANGSIQNEDINAAADIDPSKIAGTALIHADAVFLPISPVGGGADDMPSIIAALADLPPGGTVTLAPGDFVFATRDGFDVPCIIQGAGADQTRITITTQGPVTVATSNVTWRGVTFVGDNTSVGDETFLFDATLEEGGFTGWKFEDCVFDSVGVKFAKVGALTPTVGVFTTVGTGFAGKVTLLRCELKNHKEQYAVECQGIEGASIVQCWIHSNGTVDNLNGEGVKIDYGASDVTVRDCLIEDNYRDGVDTYTALSAKIVNNTIRNNAQQGVEVKWATTNPPALIGANPKITIIGNTIYGNGSTGVVACCDNIIVRDNHVYDNVVNQISSGGAFDASATVATSNVTIVGNVTSGGQYGIDITGAVHQFVIADNVCEASSIDGIHLEPPAAYGVVHGNVAFGNGNKGIRVNGTAIKVGRNSSQDGAAGCFVVADADAIVSASGERRVYKASATARNNTASPTADPDLTFPGLPANSVWAIRGCLYVSSASEVPDLKVGWSVPAGASGRGHLLGGSLSLTTWAVPVILTGSTLGNGSIGVDDGGVGAAPVNATIIIGATAGTVALTWSQNTPDPADVNMLEGSWLEAVRIT